MIDQWNLWLLIFGMAAGVIFSRFLPYLFLSEWSPKGLIKRAMDFVPVAVLGAMILPAVLLKSDEAQGSSVVLHRPEFYAFLPTVMVAYLSRNIGATVFSGIGSIALLRLFI